MTVGDQAATPAHGGVGRGLTARIFAGMAAGVATGVALKALQTYALAPEGGAHRFVQSFLLDGVLFVGGAVFMASLKLLVVPLVFFSLVCGTASLDDLSRLGRIGAKTMLLYLATTSVAISLALGMASLVGPGEGLELPTDLVYSGGEAPGLAQTLVDIFPTNPVQAMAEGNMLQIIVFSLLFGFAMTLSGEPGRRLLRPIEDVNRVVLRLVTMLMEIAPLGVFCLLARMFAEQGLSAIVQMASYFTVVLVTLLLHGGVVYPAMLRALAGLDPRSFLRKWRAPLSFAFSTASSNATLPVSLETIEERLGVDNRVASFTMPLGATINMDGTAIMQGVATVFIAQAYGIDLHPVDFLMVIVTATLASIGTAGVPGVGLIMLAMVLRQVDLPVDGIALIIGVDRLLDMVRTCVNVTGDAVVTCIVASSEGQLDRAVYDGP